MLIPKIGSLYYVKLSANSGLVGKVKDCNIVDEGLLISMTDCMEVYPIPMPIRSEEIGLFYMSGSPSDKFFDVEDVPILFAVSLSDRCPLGKLYLEMKAKSAGLHVVGPSQMPPPGNT